MSVLEFERADPGLLVALCRHLDRAEATVERSEIRRRFLPGAIDRGDGKAPELTLRNTLDFACRVGLFGESQSELELETEHRGKWGPDVAWQTVADVLFSPGVAGVDPFEDDDAPAGDFARLAAWFVNVDPTGPPLQFRAAGEGHPKTLMKEMGGDPAWVPNDQASWSPFVWWMTALGLGRERPTGKTFDRNLGLLPDVYRAVRDRLEVGRASKGKVETLESLLDFLGRVLPVAATGRLDQAWRRHIGTADDRRLSPALSFALVRLQQEGAVQLIQSGDGVPYALVFGRYENVPSPFGPRSAQERRYSGVQVLGGGAA